MSKYLLTLAEIAEFEAEGLLESMKAGGSMGGPGRIIVVTEKQSARIKEIREGIGKAKRVGLHGSKYSEEPYLSLLIAIEGARSLLETAQSLAPNCKLFDAPKVLREQGTLVQHLFVDQNVEFFDQVSDALACRDAAFFTRVAEILADRIGEDAADRWTVYLISSYRALLGNVPDIIPNKKQVREEAVRRRAEDDAYRLAKGAGRNVSKAAFLAKGSKAVELAYDRLLINDRPGDWTDRWKKAGLTLLESDPGGQPAHKKSKTLPSPCNRPKAG